MPENMEVPENTPLVETRQSTNRLKEFLKKFKRSSENQENGPERKHKQFATLEDIILKQAAKKAKKIPPNFGCRKLTEGISMRGEGIEVDRGVILDVPSIFPNNELYPVAGIYLAPTGMLDLVSLSDVFRIKNSEGGSFRPKYELFVGAITDERTQKEFEEKSNTVPTSAFGRVGTKYYFDDKGTAVREGVLEYVDEDLNRERDAVLGQYERHLGIVPLNHQPGYVHSGGGISQMGEKDYEIVGNVLNWLKSQMDSPDAR